MATINLIQEAIGKYGSDKENLLPVLQHIVYRSHWLSEENLIEVAKAFELSPAEVYGVASFYSFLDTKPRGKNVIRICKTISCDLKGKSAIIEAIESKLRIKLGETTPDGLFSFLETNCIGWCNKGPAMLINEQVFTELTEDKAASILEEFIRNEKQ